MNSKITTEFERLSVERMLNLDSKYRRYWIVSDKIEDENKYLVVFSYIGKNDSMDEKYVSQYRGFVMDIKNNIIVAKSYGVTETYQHDQFHQDYQKYKLDALKIYRAREGVLLRIFKYQGILYICTHRKLDFKLSIYRPGMTFKEMFDSFEGSLEIIDKISEFLENEKSVFFLFMVHPKLTVADTNNDKFGIFYFCKQSQDDFKISYDFPDFMRNTSLIEQVPVTAPFAYNEIVGGTDVYNREASSILIIKDDKPYIYNSYAFEFRKNILGEEQTLYPSFCKRVFDLKTRIRSNAVNVYYFQKPENMSYSDYIYNIYLQITPDCIKDMLIQDGKTLSQKYSLDYHETFDWIRKNPKSILDYCKEGRISTTLARMRMTQNFLTLEAYVEKNCSADQFYTIVTDAKKSKHMYEKHLQDKQKNEMIQ